MYLVIDGQTQTVIGTYKNRNTANTKADKRNNDYGAHRYRVVSNETFTRINAIMSAQS
jgi:hypothetical protein